MIKDLLQYKFTDYNTGYTQVRTPKTGHNRSQSLQKSLVSAAGDPKKNSDKLKFLLLSIKFPQQYNEKEALEGHPTQFMKIINYSLFVASASVKKYLFSKEVDPDTVYLNDYKFMKKVFHIITQIFGYRPNITLEQFFKYGFAEQKMLICCDVINLVKKASRDLKIQKSLTRKRSETTRDLQVSSYTIINHSKVTDAQKDFVYERDTVNKTAKVSRLNQDLQEQRQSLRDSRRSSIQDSRNRSTQRLSASAGKSINNSFRYTHVQSRYMLPAKNQLQQQEVNANVGTALPAEYKPLRVRAKHENTHDISVNKSLRQSQSPQQEQKPSPQKQAQQVQSVPSQQQNVNNISIDLMFQLKQTIESLNSKFENFQCKIDNKIETIHQDYQSLNIKLETLNSTKNGGGAGFGQTTLSQADYGQDRLRERGEFISPSHFGDRNEGPSSVINYGDVQVKNLREFTFSEKGSVDQNQRMYSTDGFLQSRKAQVEDLREESQQLIDNIRRNFDESKREIENYSANHARNQSALAADHQQ